MYIVMLASLMGVGVARIRHLPGRGCRGIATSGQSLGVDGTDGFLIAVNLLPSLLSDYIVHYKNGGDNDGAACMSRLEKGLNSTFADLHSELLRYSNELKETRYYLKNFDKLEKRAISAGVFAILLGIANAFATGIHVVNSNIQYNHLEHRLNLIGNFVEKVFSNQVQLNENVNFLSDSQDMFGVHVNLIGRHVNHLKVLHSCDVLEVGAHVIAGRLVSDGSAIKSAVYGHVLTHELLDYDHLRDLTTNDVFAGTIFQVSPSMLYDYARIDMISYADGNLLLLCNFPRITKEYAFNVFQLLQSPVEIQFEESNDGRVFEFLTTKDVSLDDLTTGNVTFYSSSSCITNNEFRACPGGHLLLHSSSICLHSLLIENEGPAVNCHVKHKLEKGYSINVHGSHAVLDFDNSFKLINTTDFPVIHEIVYSENTDHHSCVFLTPDPNVSLLSESEGIIPLFSPMPMFTYDHPKLNVILNFSHIVNLSLPTLNSSHVFKPIVFPDTKIFHKSSKNGTGYMVISLFVIIGFLFIVVAYLVYYVKIRTIRVRVGSILPGV